VCCEISARPQDVLTCEQVAELLPVPVNPETVRRWYRSGVRGERLQPTFIGRKLFFRADDVNKFLSNISGR